MKETVAKERSATGRADWGAIVPKAARAFSANDLEYLMPPAPEDVKQRSGVEFMLKRKNLEFVRHNVRLLAKKTNRLTDRGHFRAFVQPPRAKGWRRVGDVR